ncbi:MAG: lipopolysaccharide heptosyltransferase I [Methylococcales bacterium]
MKIAIVKLSSLGDIIHAMVALQFIKADLNELQIDWIVEQRFAEVLKYNPHIDNIHCVDFKSLKKNKSAFFSEIRKIMKYTRFDYDLVIDAQGLIKSAAISNLLGKKTAGFDRRSIREKPASWFYDEKINYPYDANTIDRNVAVIAGALGLKITPRQIQNKQPFLFFRQTDYEINDFFPGDKKTIVFVIGSTWESRNYPKEKFHAIAETLEQNCLVIWNTEAERNKAQWLSERSSYITMLPKIDLNNLKAAIAKADLLIGNDTGPTHLAWGLNRPSITIFGPTPVNRVYQTSINKVVKSSSKVNPFKLNKNDFSIRDIHEKLIIEKAIELLK